MMRNDESSSHAKRSRVFIVEDHHVVREGLTLLIDGEKDLSVCGTSAGMRNAMADIRQLKPDVIVVDIALGDGNGLDLIEEIHQFDPNLPVLALSMHDEGAYAERALRAGAKGYVMKSEAMDKVRLAIRRVLRGEICISEAVSAKMVQKLVNLRLPGTPSMLDSLTDREFQVFRLLAEDAGPTEIAKRMNLSVKTIETHRMHIKEKLGLKSGAELRRYLVGWSEKGR